MNKLYHIRTQNGKRWKEILSKRETNQMLQTELISLVSISYLHKEYIMK